MIHLGKELTDRNEGQTRRNMENQYQIKYNSEELYDYYIICGSGSSYRLFLDCWFGISYRIYQISVSYTYIENLITSGNRIPCTDMQNGYLYTRRLKQ